MKLPEQIAFAAAFILGLTILLFSLYYGSIDHPKQDTEQPYQSERGLP